MGFSNSKWRKILIILSIINLCFVLFARFTRVFGATSNFYVNVTSIEKNQTVVTLGSSQYGGIRNFKVPQFIYDFKNIIIAYSMSKYNTSTKTAYLIVSNNDIYFKNGDFAGDGTASSRYYTYSISGLSNSTIDISNIQLSDMRISAGNGNYFLGGIYNNTSDYLNYSYMGLLGTLYDFTTKEVIAENLPYFYPHFQNISEIEGSTFNDVIISRGDYSFNDYLYFHLLEITYVISDTNPTTYYYSDKIFALNKDSKYYYTYRGDTENQYSYYAVPRSALGLNPNSSYLYVLTNSQEGFNNSSGILEEDEDNGVYDVIQSDTTGVITSDDSINDKIQNIDDTINDNTISGDTETDIENSLNFDNQNEGLNNLNNGFFSRLTTMLSNLLGYNLGEDTSVSLPLPNSNKSIVLHSIDIYNNVTGALRLIINAFWVYIFSFYMWKFINKIYIAVSTGNILDTFSSSGEAITNDML